MEEGGAHILDNTHFFEFHFESATYTIIFVIITLLISILVFSMMWSLYSKCLRDEHCAACVKCCVKHQDPDPYFVPPYPASHNGWGQQQAAPFGGGFGYPAHHLHSAPQVHSHRTHAPNSVSNPRFQNRFYLDPTNLVSNHPLLACPGTPQVAAAAAAAAAVAAAAPEGSQRFQELPSENPAPPQLVEAEATDDPALDKILSSSQP